MRNYNWPESLPEKLQQDNDRYIVVHTNDYALEQIRSGPGVLRAAVQLYRNRDGVYDLTLTPPESA